MRALRLVGLVFLGFAVVLGCSGNDDPAAGERCANCSSDSDCQGSLVCAKYDDGSDRCSTDFTSPESCRVAASSSFGTMDEVTAKNPGSTQVKPPAHP